MARARSVAALVAASTLVASTAHAQPSPDADAAAVTRDAYLDRSTHANAVLTSWAAASIAAGGLMFAVSDDAFVEGMAMQHVLWGGIDALIAGVSMILVSQQRGEVATRDDWIDRASTAETVFWVNAALDIAYIATGAGIWLLSDDEQWKGTGAGIITQGAFLLGFDATAGLVMGRDLP